MFQAKVLIPALLFVCAGVWGVLTLQDKATEAPAAAPAAPENSTATAFNPFMGAGPVAGRRPAANTRRASAAGPAPLLSAGDNAVDPAAADPARAAERDARRATRQSGAVQREAYRQKAQQLPQSQRQAWKAECASRGLSKHDMQCLQLLDTPEVFANSGAPKSKFMTQQQDAQTQWKQRRKNSAATPADDTSQDTPQP